MTFDAAVDRSRNELRPARGADPTGAEERATRQARLARAVIGALVEAGVRDVVLSPGSRSTPLVLAVHARLELRCHVVLDERAAAFVALGQARVTGRPSILLCTSGTAPAHYLPALVEAALARLPVLVLSADRPLALQACGAPQTVDQVKLFGDHVRFCAELPEPGPDPRCLEARRIAAQAVARALHPDPGPVHLNARFTKPLEPPAGESVVDAFPPVPRFHPPRSIPDPSAIDAVVEACRAARRGVIVCGPAPLARPEELAAIAALSRATGFPLLAEATSQLRFASLDAVRCDGFDAIYRTPQGRARLRPDLVLQLGATPTSRGYDELVREIAPRRIVIAPYGVEDPWGSAAAIVQVTPASVASAVAEQLGASPTSSRAAPMAANGATGVSPEQATWARALSSVDALVWRAVRAAAASAMALTEGAAARTVVGALPREALLVLANSLAVREVDLWCESALADVSVLSQRGANGIDGLVSGAAGAALAAAGRPVVLLTGDVAFLHDVGGLLPARAVCSPLVVVVLNNDGGRIFEQLPLAARPQLSPALPLFTTPHGLDLAHAAALYGARFARPGDAAALAQAVGRAASEPGCTVIEVRVPPPGAAAEDARLLRAVDRALAEASS